MSKAVKSKTLRSILHQRRTDVAFQLNQLAREIHEDADRHGLWDDFRKAMQEKPLAPGLYRRQMMRYYATSVVAGELTEMRAASEHGRQYAEEAADVLIAHLSLCAELGIDIGAQVVKKMAVNRNRPHKHGKESCYEPTPL